MKFNQPKKRDAMRDHSVEADVFVRRATIAFGLILIAIAVLLVNMHNLQINAYETYQTRSNKNSIKVLPIAPNRGLIYDRNGVLLAENRPVFDLEITPEQVSSLPETAQALAELLGQPDEKVASFLENSRFKRRFNPLTFLSRLTDEQVALFTVNQHKFPGVRIQAQLKRHYPYRDVLTHALGYVARINSKDAERLDNEGKGQLYAATRDIGKQGIERYYEHLLHGEPGYREVEVNNRGKILRTLNMVPPKPGKDLILNIDLELQLKAQKELGERRGAVVLLDAESGGVLALVSNPSYDPNLFVHGISSQNYSALLNSRDLPLINRATQGRYPPASTIKPQMAILALEQGVITPNTVIFDPGFFQIPNTKRRFRDWKRRGHGKVNVYKAIEQSSDTFFYHMAYALGIDRIHDKMSMFGFGDRTGIDIHEETSALMPSRGWKRARYNQPWYQGDTISIGIGQGYWTATPVQLAMSTSVIAMRGKRSTPHLLRAIQSEESAELFVAQPRPSMELKNVSNWQVAKDGMFGVINKMNGTARKAFEGTPYVVGGKSGTAQVIGMAQDEEYDADKIDERHRDNAMFVAYAPFHQPKIVAAVVVENAGGGSSNAAPVVRALFDDYFANKPQLYDKQSAQVR